MRGLLVAVVLCCLLVDVFGASNYVVGGYFPNWSPDLACHGLPVSEFDASPYTHVWYAFGTVSTSNWMPSANGDEKPGGLLSQLVALKQNHTKLNILVSFGGAGQDQFFSPLTSSSSNRQTFVSNVIQWLRKYDLDGLDLDWEMPTGSAAQNYASLFAELRTAINAEHASSGKPALFLTVASYGDYRGLVNWPIVQMAQSLDWFNMMTYEEHGPWDSTTPTGINAPIMSSDGYDLTDCVNGYLALGVPSSKLLLGAPTFAHSWKLQDPSKTYIGAPGAGPGPQGKCTQSPGDLAYFEVETFISGGATVVWDNTSQTHYCYQGSTWVSYDDPRSFAAKAQLVIAKKLRGIFVWDIDEDDKNALIDSAVATLNS
jgi:chitinase